MNLIEIAENHVSSFETILIKDLQMSQDQLLIKGEAGRLIGVDYKSIHEEPMQKVFNSHVMFIMSEEVATMVSDSKNEFMNLIVERINWSKEEFRNIDRLIEVKTKMKV